MSPNGSGLPLAPLPFAWAPFAPLPCLPPVLELTLLSVAMSEVAPSIVDTASDEVRPVVLVVAPLLVVVEVLVLSSSLQLLLPLPLLLLLVRSAFRLCRWPCRFTFQSGRGRATSTIGDFSSFDLTRLVGSNGFFFSGLSFAISSSSSSSSSDDQSSSTPENEVSEALSFATRAPTLTPAAGLCFAASPFSSFAPFALGCFDVALGGAGVIFGVVTMAAGTGSASYTIADWHFWHSFTSTSIPLTPMLSILLLLLLLLSQSTLFLLALGLYIRFRFGLWLGTGRYFRFHHFHHLLGDHFLRRRFVRLLPIGGRTSSRRGSHRHGCASGGVGPIGSGFGSLGLVFSWASLFSAAAAILDLPTSPTFGDPGIPWYGWLGDAGGDSSSSVERSATSCCLRRANDTVSRVPIVLQKSTSSVDRFRGGISMDFASPFDVGSTLTFPSGSATSFTVSTCTGSGSASTVFFRTYVLMPVLAVLRGVVASTGPAPSTVASLAPAVEACFDGPCAPFGSGWSRMTTCTSGTSFRAPPGPVAGPPSSCCFFFFFGSLNTVHSSIDSSSATIRGATAFSTTTTASSSSLFGSGGASTSAPATEATGSTFVRVRLIFFSLRFSATSTPESWASCCSSASFSRSSSVSGARVDEPTDTIGDGMIGVLPTKLWYSSEYSGIVTAHLTKRPQQ
uniref:Uncharacterized protein n=1 Tax=Anopheles coluzzii TaxID=1518534 RepID=A0A8W7PMS4_ANOCL